MTPDEASTILKQATSQVPLVREAHTKVVEAHNVIDDMIATQPKPGTTHYGPTKKADEKAT